MVRFLVDASFSSWTLSIDRRLFLSECGTVRCFSGPEAYYQEMTKSIGCFESNESAIMSYSNSKSQESRKTWILVQFEVTKAADSWRKMVASGKHKRCVSNWDFLLKDMYSRYKGRVKRILCCGDRVVPSICEQLQTFPSWITYKHIFRSYLGPSLNNMYTNDTPWKSNFWTNLKILVNMIFMCCTIHWFFVKLPPYKSNFSVNPHNIKIFHL